MGGGADELRWIGAATLRAPLFASLKSSSTSRNVKTYEAVEISPLTKESEGLPSSKFTCRVGDFVHMRPETGNIPYVGRILDLFEEKGKKCASVQWLYRQEDVPSGAAKPAAGKNEIFYAFEHLDKILLDSVLAVVQVEFQLRNPNNTLGSTFRSRKEDGGPDDEPEYVCSRIFDLKNKVSLISEPKLNEIENFVALRGGATSTTSSQRPAKSEKMQPVGAAIDLASSSSEEDNGSANVKAKKTAEPPKQPSKNGEEPASSQRKKLVATKSLPSKKRDQRAKSKVSPSSSLTESSIADESSDIEADDEEVRTDEVKTVKRPSQIAAAGAGSKKDELLSDEGDDDEDDEDVKLETTVKKQRPLDFHRKSTAPTPVSLEVTKAMTEQKKKTEQDSAQRITPKVRDGEAETEIDDHHTSAKNGNGDAKPPGKKRKVVSDDEEVEEDAESNASEKRRTRAIAMATSSSSSSSEEVEEETDDEDVIEPARQPPLTRYSEKELAAELLEANIKAEERAEILQLSTRKVSDQKPVVAVRSPECRQVNPQPSIQQPQQQSREEVKDIDDHVPVGPAASAGSEEGDETEDELEIVEEQPEPVAVEQKSDKSLNEVVSSNTNATIRDLDGKLWDFYQEMRIEIGSDEALEVLGYLKLEYMIQNEKRPFIDQILPPSFILGKMNKPNMPPLLSRVRSLLGLKSPKMFSNALGVRRAFAELERCRPGTIFGLLGNGDMYGRDNDHDESFRGTWPFPTEVTSPIFGSVLGVDGFRTFKMMYQNQVMYVPIEREGSILEAAIAGFSRLVTPSFNFGLVKTGDCEFEVAPSPDERFDQVFVKTVNGRILSLMVPIEKATMKFVKVLVGAHEGLFPHQMRFVLGNTAVGGDERTSSSQVSLVDCKVKPFSTLHLVLRSPTGDA